MMRVTIVGAGNMGRGIGTRLVAGGNGVELVDQNPEDSRTLAEELGDMATSNRSVTGEVVALAPPYEAVAGAVAEHQEGIAGRIVIDIVNPVDWSTMETVTTPAETSGAEETAQLVPEGTKVVKAFNTNTTFAKAHVAGEPPVRSSRCSSPARTVPHRHPTADRRGLRQRPVASMGRSVTASMSAASRRDSACRR
jgi:predicted dinucleotide-binding enzyme